MYLIKENINNKYKIKIKNKFNYLNSLKHIKLKSNQHNNGERSFKYIHNRQQNNIKENMIN